MYCFHYVRRFDLSHQSHDEWIRDMPICLSLLVYFLSKRILNRVLDFSMISSSPLFECHCFEGPIWFLLTSIPIPLQIFWGPQPQQQLLTPPKHGNCMQLVSIP